MHNQKVNDNDRSEVKYSWGENFTTFTRQGTADISVLRQLNEFTNLVSDSSGIWKPTQREWGYEASSRCFTVVAIGLSLISGLMIFT